MDRRQVIAGVTAVAAASVPGVRAAAAKASTAAYDYYEIGDVAAARPRPTRPGMLLAGGGEWIKPAYRQFVDCAGGGRIVVLAASYGAVNGEAFYNSIGGITAAQSLIFHSREAASDPHVLDLVAKADGIYFSGGDQANYVRDWKGTPLNSLIDAHVRAGRPIGGSSAGLAILGQYAYGALDGGSIDAPTALADPLGPQVTLVEDFLHLPHLSGVITDTHFTVRHRLGRLIAFVANLSQTRDNPKIVGLGVDQEAALFIDADGIGRLGGGPDQYAWLVKPDRPADRIAPHLPLDFTSVPLSGIGPDSSIDMKTLEVSQPAFHKIADVKAGVLSVRPA